MRREVERFRGDVFPKSDYVDALAVLWHSEILGVEHFVKRDIALFPKGAEDGLKGPAAIVDGQPFDILAENHFGLVIPVGADSQHVEEQGSPGSALVIVVKALSLASQAEGLTGKPRKADVEVGNL